jgi:hypothetical protein
VRESRETSRLSTRPTSPNATEASRRANLSFANTLSGGQVVDLSVLIRSQSSS